MGTTVEQFGQTNDLDDSKNAGYPIGVGAAEATEAKIEGDEPKTALLRTKVVLDDDKIKALPGAAMQIVAAPGGENKLIVFHSAVIICDCQAGAYASDDFAANTLGFSVGGEVSLNLVGADVEGLLTTTTQRGVVYLPAKSADAPKVVAAQDLSAMVNKPLTLVAVNASGDYTSGDPANSMTVIAFYTLVDLAD